MNGSQEFKQLCVPPGSPPVPFTGTLVDTFVQCVSADSQLPDSFDCDTVTDRFLAEGGCTDECASAAKLDLQRDIACSAASNAGIPCASAVLLQECGTQPASMSDPPQFTDRTNTTVQSVAPDSTATVSAGSRHRTVAAESPGSIGPNASGGLGPSAAAVPPAGQGAAVSAALGRASVALVPLTLLAACTACFVALQWA